MALKYLPQFKTTKLNVGGGIDSSQTTGIVLLSVDGVDITKPGIVCLSWADPLNTATAEWVSYTSIDGSNELQGVVRGAEGSTGVAHANGVDIAFPVSKSHINDLNDAMLAEHTDAGVHSGLSTTAFSAFNAPEGFLINGKIVPSVASNSLTVAIKGMDGNNPSASNPVYVRIDNAIRSITSALSVTINAGSNHFNAGSSELATKEVDYFVYLNYNTGDSSVGVGISRIPYGKRLDDFYYLSSTNEKSIVNSNGSFMAVSDYHVNIGRFAATLSAGAGYTWTVPTFTATNLIQRPIYETRRLSWTPQYSAAGSLTYTSTSTTNAEYCVRGNSLDLAIYCSGTLGGSASAALYFTVPLSRVYSDISTDGYGTVSTGSGVMGFGQWASNSSTTTMAWYKYDNSNYATTGTAYIRGRARYLIA